MANHSGSAGLCTWTTSDGTTSLNTDFRNFTYNTGIELISTTAGADTDATHIVGVKSGQFAAEMARQAAGTALEAQLEVGKAGTLTYSPEGTAAGKRLYSIPATVTSYSLAQPYNDIVSISSGWERNGAHTIGTN